MKKSPHPSKVSRFRRYDHIDIDGKTISKDDVIRIDGEHGIRFMFHEHVINTENGAEWVTVFELQKSTPGPFRSFKPDRIRLLSPRRKPKVRKVVK